MLIHHDISRNEMISKREVRECDVFEANEILLTLVQAQFVQMDGISLSPPFVQSSAVSSTGIIAIGLADGRLYVGFGGDRQLAKRGKKWNGLDPSAEWIEKVAEGPIVAMYILLSPGRLARADKSLGNFQIQILSFYQRCSESSWVSKFTEEKLSQRQE